MIDWRTETVISLERARNEFTRRLSRRTLDRYATEGTKRRGSKGPPVVLETYLDIGTRWTSLEAIDRFIRRVNEK